MLEPFNSFAIGLVELTLAFAVFHRAMPAAREFGRRRAVKFWLLGLALGLFGLGRLFGPIETTPFAPIFAIAHYCLIGYTLVRLRLVARHQGAKWGDFL